LLLLYIILNTKFFCLYSAAPYILFSSPFLLLVSAFAGTLALFYMYSRLFFDLVWVCPITYYVMVIALLLFFLPYILRCYRTLMMWRFYQLASREKEDPKAKAEAEAAMNPCMAIFSKINGLVNHVAIYKKFLYSELFLCLVTAGIFIVCLLTAIIIQVILATSPAHVFDPVCQKTCMCCGFFLCFLFFSWVWHFDTDTCCKNYRQHSRRYRIESAAHFQWNRNFHLRWSRHFDEKY